jgi:UDP-N-acetylmuramyl pentapeptide phosphotransferase/UDP-N-acetylglucosamine-1-phosphate transferase
MTGLIILLVFTVSASMTWLLSKSVFGPQILDFPNERSLHTVPVPRTGGLAILAGLLPGAILLWLLVTTEPWVGWILPGTLLIALVSFFDDRFSLGVGKRLTVQLVAATILIIAGFAPQSFDLPGGHWEWPLWVAVPITVLFVTWMTNLYNFMDGMDGFAAGMTVVGFLTYAMLGWRVDATLFMLLSLALAASAGGFLLFNFPPARIFMGDVGASTIGFLVAAMSLWADRSAIFPLWVGILIFSPFIADATVTLLRRLLAGEKVWQAHRSHFYQRLVQLGWGHRKTVTREYGLMVAVGLTAMTLAYVPYTGQWVLIIIWFFVYLGLGWRICQLERAGKHSR